MKQLTSAILAFSLLASACGNTPVASNAASVANSIGSAVPSIDIAKAAHDQLCNPEGGGSLSKIASQLDKLDPNADMSQLGATLGTLGLNLQNLQVDATTKPTRDAAGTAIVQLQNALKDSSKRQAAATQAATALRAVETAVCK